MYTFGRNDSFSMNTYTYANAVIFLLITIKSFLLFFQVISRATALFIILKILYMVAAAINILIDKH